MIPASSVVTANDAGLRPSFARRLAVSVVACAVLASAMVLAQDPKPAPTPAAQPVAKTPKQVLLEAKELPKAGAKTEKAAPGKAVVRKRAVANVNLNGNPMVEQFVQQGRPIVHAELLFVRHICDLKPDQLRPISRESGEALRDVAKKMVEQQQNGIRVRANGPGSTNPDPGKMLQDGLAVVIKKHLTPDQYAHYQAESDKRSASRKKAALEFLIDVLDRDLVLSNNQREKLTESLSAHWDDGWCMYMEYMLYGNQFYPQTIDQYVTSVLNDNQKKVWQWMQKVQGFWGFGNVMGGMINDGDPLLTELGLEAEPGAAKAEIPAAKTKVRLQKTEGKKEAVSKK
jgi:hypothetical protein